MNGFSLTILGICVIVSTPGLIVALRKSAWYGMAVNSMIYVSVCTIVLCLPLFQRQVEYGIALPDKRQSGIFEFDVVEAVILGLYWLIFQISVMPLAILIRRRKGRGPVRFGLRPTAEGEHRE